MAYFFLSLCALGTVATGSGLACRNETVVTIPVTPPSHAGIPLDNFMSYSIEFSSFPDFAGNKTSPNIFSDNLLNNLADLQGTKPHIRVGGKTQDFAVFNASQEEALVGIFTNNSADYPSIITIGPAYFESYSTWPNVRFVHGFNLGRNGTSERRGLLDSVSYACEALRDKLLGWELGNEPDLFQTNPPVRPRTWKEAEYVAEWKDWTRAIRSKMGAACPELATNDAFKWYAPSFAGQGGNVLDPVRTWEAELDEDKIVGVISSHNYISGARVPGVTLQGTLMNHSSNLASVAKHTNSSRHLSALPDEIVPDNLPYVLGEHNSLYNQGRPGLSNTFGAALWGIDFNLLCASNNISRVHMHMGTNYRYQSWQPISTPLIPIGTKAPYYGNIVVAAFLGQTSQHETKITNIPFQRETQAAYAAYINGTLTRILMLNLQAYNATDYNREFLTTYPRRPVERFTFLLDSAGMDKFRGTVVHVQRLLANGSDAITGISFDGYSYNYELDKGRPVLLRNVTRGETVRVSPAGEVSVDVEGSSAVMLRFEVGGNQDGGNGGRIPREEGEGRIGVAASWVVWSMGRALGIVVVAVWMLL